jgi:PAS domain-containing protein
MRNVEEVFSALKENLDQILGNLQDGILLFTGDGRAVLVSEAARRFLKFRARTFSAFTLTRSSIPPQPWAAFSRSVRCRRHSQQGGDSY